LAKKCNCKAELMLFYTRVHID